MGLFDIFRRTQQPEVLHPIFGRIVYQGDHTWELGKALFPPVGQEVEVIIEAGMEGPSESHAQFWRELIASWPELKKTCEPLLRHALKDWIDAPENGDIWLRVEVESLTIYAEAPPEEWELMLWCEEARHWPTFVLHRWTPTECFIDG